MQVNAFPADLRRLNARRSQQTKTNLKIIFISKNDFTPNSFPHLGETTWSPFAIFVLSKLQTMKLLTLLFPVMLLVGCQLSDKTPADSTAAEEEAVKATLVAMWDAIEKGDADRYASYVHPNFTQFGEADSLLSVGKEKEVEGIREYTAVATHVHTEMVDPRVTIQGSTAWITYYWKDAGTKRGVPFASQGKSTRIFVKENGKWLCIHGHYTWFPGNGV